MRDDKDAYPRCWRFRRFFRRTQKWIRIKGKNLCTYRPIALIAPWVTGSYYLILDLWLDKWEILQQHIFWCQFIFWIFLGITLIVLFIRGVVEQKVNIVSSDSTGEEILADYIKSVGAVVQAKADRFRGALLKLGKGANKFDHITKPDDQFRVIGNAIALFLRTNYNVQENQLNITIMARVGQSNWNYIYEHQNDWNHNQPNDIMKEASAARYCLESGEELFVPDKHKASKDGKFFFNS